MLRERGGEGAGDGRGTDDGQLMTKAGPGVLALLSSAAIVAAAWRASASRFTLSST